MRHTGFPIDVLLVARSGGTWAMRNRILLEAFGHRCLIATSLEEAADAAHDVDVALVHVVGGAGGTEDPLVDIAELWQAHPTLPVVLCGDDVKEAVRAAAFEAGVAFVTHAEPMPQELDALLRLVCEQNRVGSPELVRGMARTMCNLSKLVATANDTSFLKSAVEEMSALFSAPLVSIMLFDDDREAAPLRLVAQVGLNPTVQLSPPRRGGIAEQVIQANKPRILLRRAQANGIDNVEARADITASMCVPIPASIEGGRPRGAINVARRRAYSVFTPRDLEVCVSIASLIGEALAALDARALSASLQERMRAVERLSTMGEIAAGIAHEVANPIACVRSNVDVIIDYMKQLAPYLAVAEEAAEAGGNHEVANLLDDLPSLLCETWEGLHRTDEVVRQMKALVRLNGASTRDENVVVGKLVEDTVRLLRPRVRVPVKVHVDPTLNVLGSSAELSQVIVNLVVNAADACDERRQREPLHEPEVRVTVNRDGNDAVLHVIDNGVGIQAEALERIFLPLFTTKTSEKGTGLGLAIVRRVIDDHGGRVHVRSTPGIGTAFAVALPLARASARQGGDATTGGDDSAPLVS